MYSIVEYNSNEEIMGCVNFDKLNADSALEMYWNYKLPDNINKFNIDYISVSYTHLTLPTKA